MNIFIIIISFMVLNVWEVQTTGEGKGQAKDTAPSPGLTRSSPCASGGRGVRGQFMTACGGQYRGASVVGQGLLSGFLSTQC